MARPLLTPAAHKKLVPKLCIHHREHGGEVGQARHDNDTNTSHTHTRNLNNAARREGPPTSAQNTTRYRLLFIALLCVQRRSALSVVVIAQRKEQNPLEGSAPWRGACGMERFLKDFQWIVRRGLTE